MPRAKKTKYRCVFCRQYISKAQLDPEVIPMGEWGGCTPCLDERLGRNRG